jgi:DNA-binding CsgD family transcriptional regulator
LRERKKVTSISKKKADDPHLAELAQELGLSQYELVNQLKIQALQYSLDRLQASSQQVGLSLLLPYDKRLKTNNEMSDAEVREFLHKALGFALSYTAELTLLPLYRLGLLNLEIIKTMSMLQRFLTYEVPTPIETYFPTLTGKERQLVYWWVVKPDCQTKQYAIILGVSELTVKTHTQNIFDDLDVSSKAEAIAKVLAFVLNSRDKRKDPTQEL